jgi:putative transposon-encoded protein
MPHDTQVIFDPNIVYEEDIEVAFEKSIKVFGPVGRMLYPIKDGIADAIIYTGKYGKLWYGDLDRSELYKLVELQQQLGCQVDVVQ